MRLINCNESPYSIFDNMIHMNLVDKRSPVSDRMYEVGNTTIPDHLKNKYITTHVVFDEMNRVVGIVDDIKEFDEWLVDNIVKILNIYMNQQEVTLSWTKKKVVGRYLYENLSTFYEELCYLDKLYKDFLYWIMILLQESKQVLKPFDSYIIHSKKYDLNKNSNPINYDIEEIIIRKNDFKVRIWLPDKTIFITKKELVIIKMIKNLKKRFKDM